MSKEHNYSLSAYQKTRSRFKEPTQVFESLKQTLEPIQRKAATAEGTKRPRRLPVSIQVNNLARQLNYHQSSLGPRRVESRGDQGSLATVSNNHISIDSNFQTMMSQDVIGHPNINVSEMLRH